MKKKILIILIPLLVLIGFGIGGFFAQKKKFNVPGTPIPTVVKGFTDAHAHLFDVDYIDKLISGMDKNEVEKTVLFGNCSQEYYRSKGKYASGISKEYNEKILAAYQKYPERVLPILAGFDPQNINAIGYVDEELKKGVWKGIGEMYLIHESFLDYKTRADNPVLKEIYKLLAKYDVPMFFHYERHDEEDVRVLLQEMKNNPKVKFIWVHWAHHKDLKELEKELTENPNMYVEMEEVLGFSPEQIKLFEKFSDRFMLGTDIGCSDDLKTTQIYNYTEAINLHKKLLESLTPQTAENFAYKNLFRLMGIKEK